ncbi:MAG: hypothetical protein ABIQ73_02730 [Acidimicrobiales bacterium]
MDDYDVTSWRETGVHNWARDCGYEMTHEDGLYNLWLWSPCTRVLDMVELHEVEGYLGRL